MPRKLIQAAAGKFYQDNPPPEPTGRGSTAARASTLGGLSVTKIAEYLFAGNAPTYREDNIGIADLTSGGAEPLTLGSTLSFAAIQSVEYEKQSATAQHDRLTANFFGASSGFFEMWYRVTNDPPTREAATRGLNVEIRMVSNHNNDSEQLGAWTKGVAHTYNFPNDTNVFNQVEEWESFVDTYRDNNIHQLIEAHDSVTRNNYTVILDGVPIASGTNGGHLLKWDGAGPAFPGNNSTLPAEKLGFEIGYFSVFDNAATLTLQQARELYETTALDNQNMLDYPLWVPLDSENVTVETDFFKTVTLGDVLDSTGIRSCAIPRSIFTLKVYFEIEIVNQGDSVTAVRPGIRRMITAADVGDQTTVGENGNEHHFYVDGVNLRVDRATLVHAGATDQSTGRVYGFAIDWQTGDFWVSEDGTWMQGDPETGTNPSGTLDRNTSWAAHVWNNGLDGNAVVKLRTNFYEMLYPVPLSFDSWEPKAYNLEASINGENRRQAVLDSYQELQYFFQYKFEGGDPDFLLDTNPKSEFIDWTTHLTPGNAGLDPIFEGPRLSYASADSVRWQRTNLYDARNADHNVADSIAFEFHFRQPNFSQTQACLFSYTGNAWFQFGKPDAAFNMPCVRNNFNTALSWESEIDVYGDDKPHQVIEAHDPSNNNNYNVFMDGMPVASGTNGGFLIVSRNQSGPRFNSNGNGTDDKRSGGFMGFYQEYRGPQEITLQIARELYEASVIDAVVTIAAGLEAGTFAVPDARLTASSQFDAGRAPENARLNNPDGDHWGPATADVSEWWKIDFGSVVTVKGIKTQGGGGSSNWIQTYKLEYNNDDGGTWIPYNYDETLTGNVDASSIVANTLIPFTCRYLRVRPQTWNTFPNLRAEFDLELPSLLAQGDAGLTDSAELIPDSALSASSFGFGGEPEDGRLNGPAPGWIESSPSSTGWWKCDFGRVVTVLESKIQGRGDSSQYITGYEIDFNNDNGGTWNSYNSNEVLTGNVDDTSVVTNTLIPFRCRYIRIRPKTWTGWVSGRFEFTISNAFDNVDMLNNPQWFALDSVNCTVGGTGNKDLTCGDVTDNTGGRSGAIPRIGKVYFEVLIVAQGDTTAANLLGVRKLAEGSNVGFDPDVATDEYHTDGAGDVQNGQDTSLGITGTLGTAATGRIFQIAIDWSSGDWWMGTDNTLWAGIGGAGDPASGANPLTALDILHNWAVVNRVNGVDGNGQVRLITASGDLNFTPPFGFVAWEDVE